MAADIMIDLETLDTSPYCVILTIGAVRFDPKGNGVVERLELRPTIEEQTEKYNRIIDDNTIEWWAKQNKDAFRELTKNNISLQEALDKFEVWFGPKSLPIWGNGAVFDNTILGNAYFITGREPPWKCWDDRCYRTAKAMFNWIPEDKREGTYHNALDDAIHQTHHLLKLLRS